MEIYELIEQVAADGAAVILIDSDFGDLCRLCHRILVMHNGRLSGELAGPEKTLERIAQIVHASGRHAHATAD